MKAGKIIKEKSDRTFPRIVTNGWTFRIEISEGEFYKKFDPSGLFYYSIIEWRTFRGAKKKLLGIIKAQAIEKAPWRPVAVGKWP
jgi:hypothetical protein